MTETEVNPDREAWSAFRKAEQPVVIHNCKVGCVLGIIFMPAGAILDYFVYPDHLGYFFSLRLVCSALLFGVLAAFNTELGRRFHKTLGQIMVSLPLLFISGMIFQTEGAASPYYAGLNLVLMGAGLVLRWSLDDSIVLIGIATATYLVACITQNPHQLTTPFFFNNIYFLIVTGVFIATGTYFNDRLRFREWKLTEQIRLAKEETEQANVQLRELDEAKSSFFANISHELRTPLTLLLTPLESLISHATNPGLSDHKEILEIMHQNGLKLLKQINDLLELVRFDANATRLEKSEIRVGRFLNGVCLSFKGLVEEKKLQFKYEVPMVLGNLQGDREKLEKVFRNLIHNAVKFNGPGGVVSVNARAEGGNLIVKVTDTGIGISKENLPRLFDRFWQADPSARRKHQGTGIGLALAQEIVTAHEGVIEPISEEGKGTSMEVTLPGLILEAEEANRAVREVPASLAEAEDDAEEEHDILQDLFRRAELFASAANTIKGLPVQFEHDRAHVAGKLPIVLVADDEPQMRSFLKTQLQDSYQVLEASDGQEAFEMARQYHPNVILMDNMMPEVDGLESSRRIREIDSTEGIPILMLTARADEKTKLDALSAGVNDFLSKPFSLTELHVRLRNLVGAAKFEQDLARKNRRLNTTVEELHDTIHRLKDTETQLVQAEKMASLGTMSAGIVHEINNPMNYVSAAVQALATIDVESDCKEDFDDIMADINDGVGRVIEIVSSLLSFAHPDAEIRRDYSAADIVLNAQRLLSGQLKEKVTLHIDVPEDIFLHVSRNPVIQMVMNIVQNSVDAMKTKTYPEGESPTIWISSAADEDRATIVIKDNGPGIPKDIRNKIFDPFFTTKDVGAGTGLGLSICYRIAEQNQGSMVLETSLGEFTEFRLEFPALMPV